MEFLNFSKIFILHSLLPKPHPLTLESKNVFSDVVATFHTVLDPTAWSQWTFRPQYLNFISEQPSRDDRCLTRPLQCFVVWWFPVICGLLFPEICGLLFPVICGLLTLYLIWNLNNDRRPACKTENVVTINCELSLPGLIFFKIWSGFCHYSFMIQKLYLSINSLRYARLN